jgi:hypothetical protein
MKIVIVGRVKIDVTFVKEEAVKILFTFGYVLS